MKTLLLLGSLLSGLGGCSTLKLPTNAQIAAGRQVPLKLLRVYTHDAPTVIPKSKPLVFVDGRRYRAAKLNRLNPDCIDSVQVINAATGVSLYGTKGRDGVLVITTKKGRR